MVIQVPTLKTIVFEYVCKHVDVLFYKQLHKIRKYLNEQDCDDLTDYFIDYQELNEESSKESGISDTNAIQVLRSFLKSQHLPKIIWKETQKNDRICVGLEINNVPVKVDAETRSKARYLAAKLMLRKLLSKHISNSVLNKYNKHEKTYRRDCFYESNSYLRQTVPECTINSVDELQGYKLSETERWEILRNIPEYRMRRSHFMLLLHPESRALDFSFCPAVFSQEFLELVLKKAEHVESVDLNNCYKTVNSVSCIVTVLKTCKYDIMKLNINRCGFVSSEKVFATLRKYGIHLKELRMAGTIKKNPRGCEQFEKYFNSKYGKHLLVIDFTGLSLCDTELCYILQNCKMLINLNLSETKFDSRCYCENHRPEEVELHDTVITRLKELNVSRSSCKDSILKLLVDNNKGLERLYAATLQLSSPLTEPLELKELEQLRALDISFQGCGAYEDFSFYKGDLPISLFFLNASGFCDMDMSHLSVVCPYLTSLTLNASIINTNITCRTREDSQGRVITVPHSLQQFPRLVRLELRYTRVNLRELLESSVPLPLRELIIEGDSLDDHSLEHIVNSDVSSSTGRRVHVFENLTKFHICNCNNVTDFGIDSCKFTDMPSLKNLTIERCSGVRPGKLKRLQQELRSSAVILTCFVNDERPRFHGRNEDVEVIMG